MDWTRFENANKLWKAGRNEDAAQEFHAIAEEVEHADEKAGVLINEHKCYCQIGKLNEAREVMREIRVLPMQNNFVRMIVDFGDACMTTQLGNLEEGVLKFEKVLQSNHEELRDPRNRDLYEDLQERRGFALTSLRRYAEALPILKEAASFTKDSDPHLVYFYMGICYQDTSQPASAKEALLRAIQLGVSNEHEASARYRLGILYFRDRAFAQAKYQLESALQLPESAIDRELRKNIYHRASRTCHYLGEAEEEQRYLKLMKSL